MEITGLSLWLWDLMLVSIGLCIGGFLNVVIYRLPKMMQRQWQQDIEYVKNRNKMILVDYTEIYNLFSPSSFCPHCKKTIPIKYNIPLLGWLYLSGHSNCCNSKISMRYPIVEILTTTMVFSIMNIFSDNWFQFCALILVCSLIVLTFIDIDTQLLPDNITLPLLWCGLIANLNVFLIPLDTAVLGAAFGYIFLWAIYWVFKLVTGKEGLGYGDFKLMAALGAWFGIEAIPVLTLLSSLFGIFSCTIIWLLRGENNGPIAFGPYLALSGGILLFFHSEFFCFFRILR